MARQDEYLRFVGKFGYDIECSVNVVGIEISQRIVEQNGQWVLMTLNSSEPDGEEQLFSGRTGQFVGTLLCPIGENRLKVEIVEFVVGVERRVLATRDSLKDVARFFEERARRPIDEPFVEFI
jgi:hypothetical protein